MPNDIGNRWWGKRSGRGTFPGRGGDSGNDPDTDPGHTPFDAGEVRAKLIERVNASTRLTSEQKTKIVERINKPRAGFNRLRPKARGSRPASMGVAPGTVLSDAARKLDPKDTGDFYGGMLK